MSTAPDSGSTAPTHVVVVPADSGPVPPTPVAIVPADSGPVPPTPVVVVPDDKGPTPAVPVVVVPADSGPTQPVPVVIVIEQASSAPAKAVAAEKAPGPPTPAAVADKSTITPTPAVSALGKDPVSPVAIVADKGAVPPTAAVAKAGSEASSSTIKDIQEPEHIHAHNVAEWKKIHSEKLHKEIEAEKALQLAKANRTPEQVRADKAAKRAARAAARAAKASRTPEQIRADRVARKAEKAARKAAKAKRTPEQVRLDRAAKRRYIKVKVKKGVVKVKVKAAIIVLPEAILAAAILQQSRISNAKFTNIGGYVTQRKRHADSYVRFDTSSRYNHREWLRVRRVASRITQRWTSVAGQAYTSIRARSSRLQTIPEIPRFGRDTETGFEGGGRMSGPRESSLWTDAKSQDSEADAPSYSGHISSFGVSDVDAEQERPGVGGGVTAEQSRDRRVTLLTASATPVRK
ncbi:hypothetical protein NX059_005060 [Plenodomus lindquistii]|nr:hypothetical protein NX059_005060 [Plenodomus lindquistii]